MSNLTMPTLTVAFKQRASTSVARSQKGVVAFLIRDAVADKEAKTYTLTSTAQIPQTLGTGQSGRHPAGSFLGNVNPPKKVLLYVMGAGDTVTAEAAGTYLAGHPEV